MESLWKLVGGGYGIKEWFSLCDLQWLYYDVITMVPTLITTLDVKCFCIGLFFFGFVIILGTSTRMHVNLSKSRNALFFATCCYRIVRIYLINSKVAPSNMWKASIIT